MRISKIGDMFNQNYSGYLASCKSLKTWKNLKGLLNFARGLGIFILLRKNMFLFHEIHGKRSFRKKQV